MEQKRDGDWLGDNYRSRNQQEEQQRQTAMVVDDEQELRHADSGGAAAATGDEELYFRHHPFTKQFTAAIHCLLISCSRQEVLSYFSHFQPRQQDFLYKVYTLTVTQIYENCVAEFRSICKKSQVLEALDHVNSEEFLSINIRQSISPREVVREVAVKRKQEELNLLKEKLQQTKEENRSLFTDLEGLRENFTEAKDLSSVDAVIEKILNINLKLEKLISGDTISSRNLRKYQTLQLDL